MLDAPNKLGKIVVGMSKVLGEIPVTIKLRTGVKDGRNTAHKLMPRLPREFGVGAVTLHGRTRQQRYTKLADWQYIRQCAEALRNASEEENSAWFYDINRRGRLMNMCSADNSDFWRRRLLLL